jgi:raffinose/stachyose/melibiose transport system substrate-binding protein
MLLIVAMVFGLTGCKRRDKDEGSESAGEVSKETEEEYDELISKAKKAYTNGDVDKAESNYKKAIKLIPEYGRAYKQLYNLYMDEKDYEEAASILKKGKSNVIDEDDIKMIKKLLEEYETETANINTGEKSDRVTDNSGKTEYDDRKEDFTEGRATTEKTVLKLWSITVDTDSNRGPYLSAIQDIERENPNIEIVMEPLENEAYKEKIKTAMAADDVDADIFFAWAGDFLHEFVKQDRVYALDDVLQPYIGKDIESKMLANVTYNGHIYGVPTTMNVVTLFANMDMLKSVGYNDVPKTYDQLIDCCDKLVASGKIPFGCACGETWCSEEYFEPLAEKIIGSDELSRILMGEATFYNEGLAKAVDLLQAWLMKGYFDPAGITTGNESIKKNFIDGNYAFYQNGSWNCVDFTANAKFEVKVAEFPVIDSSKSSIGQLIGGPSDTLSVYKGSKNAATAAEVVVKLSKKICQYAYICGNGIPAWNVNVDDSKIDPLTKAVGELCRNATKFTLFGDNMLSTYDRNVYYAYLDKIFVCAVDGNGFIAGLRKDIK